MQPEHQPQPDTQRRQFGRREDARAAIALLQGGQSVACTVENISEAGALVAFPNGPIPARSFRLTIDGAPITMVCEPRHSQEARVGVKFLNQSDGVRLMAFLHPMPPSNSAEIIAPSLDRPSTIATHSSNRDLRQQVLSSLAERVAAEPVNAAGSNGQTLPQQILSRLANLARPRTPAEPSPARSAPLAVDDPPQHAARPEPSPAVVLTDEMTRGYQPKRSRRNGIKGKSAGGIG